MRKTNPFLYESHFEIWSDEIVNAASNVMPEEIGYRVIQIEPGSRPGEYMVEVVDVGPDNKH